MKSTKSKKDKEFIFFPQSSKSFISSSMIIFFFLVLILSCVFSDILLALNKHKLSARNDGVSKNGGSAIIKTSAITLGYYHATVRRF